jgi:hypothetical protein
VALGANYYASSLSDAIKICITVATAPGADDKVLVVAA